MELQEKSEIQLLREEIAKNTLKNELASANFKFMQGCPDPSNLAALAKWFKEKALTLPSEGSTSIQVTELPIGKELTGEIISLDNTIKDGNFKLGGVAIRVKEGNISEDLSITNKPSRIGLAVAFKVSDVIKFHLVERPIQGKLIKWVVLSKETQDKIAESIDILTATPTNVQDGTKATETVVKP